MNIIEVKTWRAWGNCRLMLPSPSHEVLWPWRWLEPETQGLGALFSCLCVSCLCFSLQILLNLSGTVTAGSFRHPAASRSKGEYRLLAGSSWKRILVRHSDWLRLGHVAFPGPMALVKGNGMLWLARVRVTCSSLRLGEEGVLRRGVLDRPATPTAVSICFQVTEVLCCFLQPHACL